MQEVYGTLDSCHDGWPAGGIPGAGTNYRVIPRTLPLQGSEGLEDLALIFVPKIFFPERKAFLDTASVAEMYGIGKAWGGSSPVMIIGDLFSRWGWGGIIMGMGALGFACPGWTGL